MYYFENLSLDESAKKEGTTHQAISKSTDFKENSLIIQKGKNYSKKLL